MGLDQSARVSFQHHNEDRYDFHFAQVSCHDGVLEMGVVDLYLIWKMRRRIRESQKMRWRRRDIFMAMVVVEGLKRKHGAKREKKRMKYREV
ncbi:hypothetical protein HanPSC8_Chr16g0742121 [Helianthus annuus]|nr:hypothetical protein HanPSC8_Chr16g0742121 [Helianthus annuus]